MREPPERESEKSRARHGDTEALPEPVTVVLRHIAGVSSVKQGGRRGDVDVVTNGRCVQPYRGQGGHADRKTNKDGADHVAAAGQDEAHTCRSLSDRRDPVEVIVNRFVYSLGDSIAITKGMSCLFLPPTGSRVDGGAPPSSHTWLLG